MNALKLLFVCARLVFGAFVLFLALASPVHAQTSGAMPFSLISTASNNSTLVYNDRNWLKTVLVGNSTGTQQFLKLYDKSTAPTCGTDTPALRIVVPANTNGGGMVALHFTDTKFNNGLGFCLVGGAADNDNSNAQASVYVNLTFTPQ